MSCTASFGSLTSFAACHAVIGVTHITRLLGGHDEFTWLIDSLSHATQLFLQVWAVLTTQTKHVLLQHTHVSKRTRSKAEAAVRKAGVALSQNPSPPAKARNRSSSTRGAEDELSPVDLSNAAWAFARAGCKDRVIYTLLGRFCEPRLKAFPAYQLSVLPWSLAVAGVTGAKNMMDTWGQVRGIGRGESGVQERGGGRSQRGGSGESEGKLI